ncbi:MAG: hypothetical protein RQ833_12205 [Sphingomonadaceae bacterium]|nr:hypothetical protein [Sphingomonadaceae bacterium]
MPVPVSCGTTACTLAAEPSGGTTPASDGPAARAPTPTPLAALIAATEAELAALDLNDGAALAAATRAKTQALLELEASPPGDLPRAELIRAAELNRLAGRRINLARHALGRQIERLAARQGTLPPATYARP